MGQEYRNGATTTKNMGQEWAKSTGMNRNEAIGQE